MSSRLVSCVVSALAVVAVAQAQTAKPIPRTADGKPDLTGVWVPRGPGNAIEMKILAQLEDLYKPEAVQAMGNLGEVDDPLLRCLPYGVPRSNASSPWPFQIVQHAGMVVVLTEYYHAFRLIPYGDTLTHSPDVIPTYFGDSVARWDGDTLVVDVTALNDKTWLADGRDKPRPTSKGRWPHSDAEHVVERWHMVDGDTVEYEATVEDPKMLSGPWTTPKITAHRSMDQKIGEGICYPDAEALTDNSLANTGKRKP